MGTFKLCDIYYLISVYNIYISNIFNWVQLQIQATIYLFKLNKYPNDNNNQYVIVLIFFQT